MRSLSCTAIQVLVIGMVTVSAANRAFAEELTAETYCSLSVARLESAVRILESEARAPTDQDEEVLWRAGRTSRDAFYGYAGAHSGALQAYLTSRPELAATIDSLSKRLRELVNQLDAVRSVQDEAGTR